MNKYILSSFEELSIGEVFTNGSTSKKWLKNSKTTAIDEERGVIKRLPNDTCVYTLPSQKVIILRKETTIFKQGYSHYAGSQELTIKYHQKKGLIASMKNTNLFSILESGTEQSKFCKLYILRSWGDKLYLKFNVFGTYIYFNVRRHELKGLAKYLQPAY